MKKVEGSEVVDSLTNLTTKEEMHNDPNMAYRMRCKLGTKSVRGECVDKDKTVTVVLSPKVGKALTRFRDAVAGGRL